MPRIPRDLAKRPEPLNTKQVRDMIYKPLNNPYIGKPMNRPALQDYFSGAEFSIRLDGVVPVKYKVKDSNTLYWWKDGVDCGWEEEYYECYETSSKGLYFLFHQLRNESIATGRVRVFAIDTANNLVSLVSGTIGLEDYTPRDTDATAFFGYVDWYDGAEPPKERHTHTLELIQRNILWKVNSWNQIHYYTERRFFQKQQLGPENGQVTSEPARHIKLRDDVYMFYWREMQSSGMLSVDIMDLNKFYGVGVLYGCTDYVFLCCGFTRENGKFVTDEELREFERIFDETNDQKYALKTVFDVDMDDVSVAILNC
jgi:hypothetical protein